VFKYGDKGHHFYIILKGKVSVRVLRPEKMQKNIENKMGSFLKTTMV
jgi:hypothetical protein